MGAALSLMIFALPTVLVAAAFYVLRSKPFGMRVAILLIVGAAWALALLLMISYNQQTNDVGLMVHGILALAMSASALIATLAAAICWRRA